MILPSTALATIPAAIIARITRASMLEVLHSDFIRTAKAKGVRSFFIIYQHGLKNALIPILTIIGLQTGTLAWWSDFNRNHFCLVLGIGRYIYDAISYRDYPVIQTGILVVALIFVLINFIVDILYAVIDPRIKY
nr:ABC transporter permease [Bacillus safensis]